MFVFKKDSLLYHTTILLVKLILFHKQFKNDFSNIHMLFESL